jgi:hypothetical protein
MHTLPISKFCLIRRYSEAEAWERTLLILELQCLSKRRQRSAHCSVSSSNSRFGNCKQKYVSCLQLTNWLTYWTDPTQHTVGLHQAPGHAGVCGNEIANRLVKGGTTQKFKGPETFLGVSTQNINNKIKCWLDNQHLASWHGPCSTQRQARKLISGASPATKARLLSFNTT